MKTRKAGSPNEWSAAALGAFFVAHRSEFLSHARRVASSPSEAEELVQDALVRVLLACPELVSAEHARSYFHRVIENLSIDHRRREGSQPRMVLLEDVVSELDAQWSVDIDHAHSISIAEDAAIIREAISLLSPAERAALVMWEFEGRSTAEIARELGVKEVAVRHTLSRARSGLRRILSERIIDEARGLTALDVLSVTYRKAAKAVQKSAKVATSLVIVLIAYFGFNVLGSGDFIEPPFGSSVQNELKNGDDGPQVDQRERVESDLSKSDSEVNVSDLRSVEDSKKLTTREFAIELSNPEFYGLDAEGIPTGFTVTDSLGSSGQLFSGRQRSLVTETGLLVSNIVSTRAGAANVLLDQSVIVDAFGTSYIAQVSVGIKGGWHPLLLSYLSSDVERLASGNYLLTATMVVDSALETSIKVSTGTSGTDLNSAPDSLTVKVLLNSSKTEILAQAVLVSADSQGNGA